MLPTAIHSSSKCSALQLAHHSGSSADREINTLEQSTTHHFQSAPPLPPELIEKILYYFATPYESIKSIHNLYALRFINKAFYESVIDFFKKLPFEFLKCAEKDISLLKNIKRLEDDMNNETRHKNIKANIKIRIKLLIKYANRTYEGYELDKIGYYYYYVWGISLKNSKNFYIDFHKKGVDASLGVLHLLECKKNIQNLCIIADSTFACNISMFFDKLKVILDNNKNLSNINYLSLKRSNIHSSSAIDNLIKALSGRKINTLNLSENRVRDKYAPDLAKFLQLTKIYNLHLRKIGISDEGIPYIIDSLPKDLKYLNLSDNDIKSEGANLLFNKLKLSKTKIEHIYLQNINLQEKPVNSIEIENETGELIEFKF